MNACLRCGTFTERWPVSGLALCDVCLEPREGTRRWLIGAPRGVGPGPLLIAAMLGALAVGPVAGLLVATDRWAGLFVGTALGIFTAIPLYFLPHFQRGRQARWKAHALAVHGVPPGVGLALLAHRSVAGDHSDFGALVVAPGGVAYFGQHGTRLAVPRASVAETRTDNGWLTLITRAGATHRFLVLEPAAEVLEGLAP